MAYSHRFFLDVPPKATERSRCTCRGRFATVYTAPAYRAWSDLAIPALRRHVNGLFTGPRLGPVRITTEAVFARPKTTKLAAPRGDLDNIEKGLWDAMTKARGWWEDDNQIVESRTTKRWAEPGEDAGYNIEVEFLS